MRMTSGEAPASFQVKAALVLRTHERTCNRSARRFLFLYPMQAEGDGTRSIGSNQVRRSRNPSGVLALGTISM
jgi:hypothetical protein